MLSARNKHSALHKPIHKHKIKDQKQDGDPNTTKSINLISESSLFPTACFDVVPSPGQNVDRALGRVSCLSAA